MKPAHYFKIFLQVKYVSILLQRQVTVSDAITLTSANIQDGHWELVEGTAVTLVCTNYPYTGVHIWKYDLMSVAECNIKSCEEHISKLQSDLGPFTFENDTEKGVFRWIINPVKTHYDGKAFKCSDGIETLRFTARVIVLHTKCDSCLECGHCFSLSVGSIVMGVLAAIISISIYITKKTGQQMVNEINMLLRAPEAPPLQ